MEEVVHITSGSLHDSSANQTKPQWLNENGRTHMTNCETIHVEGFESKHVCVWALSLEVIQVDVEIFHVC